MTRRTTSLLIGGAVALAAAAAWGIAAPPSFFAAYLLAFLFWSSLPLGAAAILMLHLLTGGRWGWSIRAPLLAAVRTTPLLWLGFLPLVLGVPRLYAWAQPGGPPGPSVFGAFAYLSPAFFLIRSAIYLAVWTLLAFALQRARPDHQGRLAAGGLIALIISASFAAMDWVSSLAPTWYSSIFPLYVVLGQVLTWMAVAVIVALRPAAGAPPIERVRLDLGNLLLTLVILHAYVGFSQLLIIWNANKPHEIAWYLPRIRHGWQWLTVALAVTHFVLPFAALLARPVKTAPARLRRVAMFVLLARVLDCVWLVVPGVAGVSLAVAPLAVLAFAGLGAGWLAAFLGARPAPQEASS